MRRVAHIRGPQLQLEKRRRRADRAARMHKGQASGSPFGSNVVALKFMLQAGDANAGKPPRAGQQPPHGHSTQTHIIRPGWPFVVSRSARGRCRAPAAAAAAHRRSCPATTTDDGRSTLPCVLCCAEFACDVASGLRSVVVSDSFLAFHHRRLRPQDMIRLLYLAYLYTYTSPYLFTHRLA